jgi:hypothetical protein
MKDSLVTTPSSLRGHQKIKRNRRKFLLDLPGHKRLDPNEKKYKALHKYRPAVKEDE